MLMQDSDGSAFTYDSFIRVNPRKKRKGKNKVDDPTPCDRLTRVREELEADGSWSLGCTRTYDSYCVREIRPFRSLVLPDYRNMPRGTCGGVH